MTNSRMLPPPAAASGTQAIARAAALLRELASNQGDERSLADLSRSVGLERPTAHRILRRLVEEQLVRQNPATRAYRLGLLVYELGMVAEPPSELHALCDIALDNIAGESGDTAFAFVASALDCVCFDRREGSYPVKALMLDVGRRRPMGMGAGSLAMLSALLDEEAERILASNAQRLELAGESDHAELLSAVAAARTKGYALKAPAAEKEILSIGMAVRNAYGRPVLGFSISALHYRITRREEDLVLLLRKEVERTEKLLVGTRPGQKP